MDRGEFGLLTLRFLRQDGIVRNRDFGQPAEGNTDFTAGYIV